MATASLSYKDEFAWGLRVNPSFNELVKSTKKPLRIPVPDRSAKWFALSNYRSFMLDAAKKYNDYEHMKLDYDGSGAHLPQATAMTNPSADGDDPTWDRVRHHTQQAEEQDAYELAFSAMEAEHRQQAAQTRAEHLAATHTPTIGHWFTDVYHQEMEDAGVEHDGPVPQPRFQRVSLPAPVHMPVAAGQIGLLRDFRTFEELNMGQPRTFRQGHMSTGASSSTSYDQLRDNALGR